MNEIDTLPDLFWEDEAADSERWWLSRAREIGPAGRSDYFIVADDLTPTFVAVTLPPRARKYRVVAVAPFVPGEGTPALDRLKAEVSARRAGTSSAGMRPSVIRWRLARFGHLVARYSPLVLVGFIGGALTGLLVALVAISARFTGWPMVLTGMAIGAGAGPALKFLVDRGGASRPWARFAIAALAAAAGAAAGAGTMFALYWN